MSAESCSRSDWAAGLLALMFTGDMLVAYITADREALLSIFSKPDNFSAAAPFTFLVASLIILIFGPGRFSLDYLIARYWHADDSDVRRRQPIKARQRALWPWIRDFEARCSFRPSSGHFTHPLRRHCARSLC